MLINFHSTFSQHLTTQICQIKVNLSELLGACLVDETIRFVSIHCALFALGDADLCKLSSLDCKHG